MNFGERLKQLRKTHNLTQQQLATRLNVAKSIISYYENGERFPSNDVLIKISKSFHVSVDYLLGINMSKTIDVSDLTDEEIEALQIVADAFRNKK